MRIVRRNVMEKNFPSPPRDDAPSSVAPSRDIDALIVIMAALRTPGTGCAWDLQQDFASIAPYTIEEAYEVADAIARNDSADLKEELGDLLLQVVFHARLAQERKLFDFGGVVEAITAKLIRRHPHVFGEARHLDPAQVKALWGEIKAQEKAQRRAQREAAGTPIHEDGLLAGIAQALPALMRAEKLQARAAGVGFDWPDAGQVLAKIREEIGEIEEAIASGERAAMQDEIGDLLFVIANLARHLKVDPEAALRGTNAKFERRFAHIEQSLSATGTKPGEAGLASLEALWREAKRLERQEAHSS
jgi:nucleoside triphosphate diphosphatase